MAARTTTDALDALDAEIRRGGHQVPVACVCGWDADGNLVLCDVYAREGYGRGYVGVYNPDEVDIDYDGRVTECGCCDEAIENETVVRRHPRYIVACEFGALAAAVEVLHAEVEQADPFVAVTLHLRGDGAGGRTVEHTMTGRGFDIDETVDGILLRLTWKWGAAHGGIDWPSHWASDVAPVLAAGSAA